MSAEVAEIHDRIREDIRAKTGLSCPHLGGFDTTVESVARAILPVLIEWVPIVRPANMRSEIYSRFGSVHAAPFMGHMIRWAKEGQDHWAAHTITFAIATAVRAETAASVWEALPDLKRTEAYYHLLAKLSTFPEVAAKAKHRLVKELEGSPLGFAELRPIADVEDPRIREWFEARADAADPRVRALARKVVDRGKRLPPSVEYSPSGPDDSATLFSTEIDLDQTENVLRQLGRDFGLKIPASIRNGRFLSRLPLDRWVIATVETQKNSRACIYFRLEDVDTVGIVATRNLQRSERAQTLH